jgi:hypothetical protein
LQHTIGGAVSTVIRPSNQSIKFNVHVFNENFRVTPAVCKQSQILFPLTKLMSGDLQEERIATHSTNDSKESASKTSSLIALEFIFLAADIMKLFVAFLSCCFQTEGWLWWNFSFTRFTCFLLC